MPRSIDSKGLKNEFLRRIAVALQDKPCCSLRELSRKLLVSPRTIQNAVKAVAGKKFRDLRDEVLLERVKNLLASAPNATIKELCFETGYRSARAFARAIRRACGISPRQLRARIAKQMLAYKN